MKQAAGDLALVAIVLASLLAVEVNSQRQPSARRIADTGTRVFSSPCGTADQISRRAGVCLAPIFELIEGRFPEPKNDGDLLAVCDRFANSEKCVRSIAKDCLTGIHKTTVGAIASAMKRFRSQECKTLASRMKYMDALVCATKKDDDMVPLFKNFTAMAQGVRDLPISPEEKLIKMCCLLNAMDRGIEASFNKDCPASTPRVLSIVHGITDDARSTLCINPKCQNALRGVTNRQYIAPQNFIEPVSQILLMLSVD